MMYNLFKLIFNQTQSPNECFISQLKTKTKYRSHNIAFANSFKYPTVQSPANISNNNAGLFE